MKRRIAVFTGTRAEYGLLYWLMKAIQANPALELQLVVSGAHMAPQFGESWKQIAADGFSIAAKIDMQLGEDSPAATAAAMGRCLAGCAEAFARLQPDILVVLGDRYEALAAAEAALLSRIPIAHIHGGELTLGAMDDAIRHAITKMAHLHFVAAEPFRQRVTQLGENPEHVFVVGAAGLDAIAQAPETSKAELEQTLGITLHAPVSLVTFHPETLNPGRTAEYYRHTLDILAAMPGTILITGTNADPGHEALRALSAEFCAAQSERCLYRENLGSPLYLTAIRHSDVVIGNSSSGVLEAPVLGTPSVNIGMRQEGRPLAPSVIQADGSRASIEAALRQALSAPHRELAARCVTPYGTAGAAARIENILAACDMRALQHKPFFDHA